MNRKQLTDVAKLRNDDKIKYTITSELPKNITQKRTTQYNKSTIQLIEP